MIRKAFYQILPEDAPPAEEREQEVIQSAETTYALLDLFEKKWRFAYRSLPKALSVDLFEHPEGLPTESDGGSICGLVLLKDGFAVLEDTFPYLLQKIEIPGMECGEGIWWFEARFRGEESNVRYSTNIVSVDGVLYAPPLESGHDTLMNYLGYEESNSA